MLYLLQYLYSMCVYKISGLLFTILFEDKLAWNISNLSSPEVNGKLFFINYKALLFFFFWKTATASENTQDNFQEITIIFLSESIVLWVYTSLLWDIFTRWFSMQSEWFSAGVIFHLKQGKKCPEFIARAWNNFI